MKRDPLEWGALVAVLVVLASAEYDLARACGFGTYVAAGVPAALDIYAVRALRAGRDVLVVVVALIAVNAAAHLVTAELLPVSWPLVVAVSAIAPLVLWRVHCLGDGHQAPAQDVPEVLPEPIYVKPEPADAVPVPQPVDEAPKVPVLGPFTPVGALLAASAGTNGGTGTDQPEQRQDSVPEPRPEPAEPVIGSGGTGSSSDDAPELPAGVSAEHVITVRTWLAVEPELTGTEIGNRLGKSDSYGRRVKRAAGAPS
ncbi:hypothetical protein [Streptomyces candidus]|uniref:DUF2637 domain-containing protein n=1 Tax=Streptomyces candidus TaxID=67283 RepID=A0A7X0HGF4_9ACTN|nr:hypothetical protein [Streptomyces candidus]MBB6437192.1 hypothetical protein [Streptomyces candidus]GHH38160.1 hypothetical protein GCM10018773_15690 [Streptomyces candidus]